MSDASAGWIWKPLGELLEHRKERGQAADLLLSVTMERGVVPQHEVGRRNNSSAEKSSYWRVHPDDIAYNSMRMWQGVSGRSNYFGIVSPAYTVCTPRLGNDPKFIGYLLKLPQLVHEFFRHSQGLTSDTWNLKYTRFRDIKVQVPPFAEQRRIVEVLITLDEAIQKAEQLIAKLKQMKQGLLHDLLNRGIDENGELRDPERDPAQFKKSPLGRIPKDWQVVSVRNAGSVQLGRQRSPATEKGPNMVPYFRVANVFDGYFDYTDILKMQFSPSEQETYSVLPGDILLNEGQSLELVGRCALYRGPPKAFCFQNTLVRFRSNHNTNPHFARQVFKYWLDTGNFIPVAKQTTSIAHLGAERFARMRFPSPPIVEQSRIVEILRAAEDSIDAEKAAASKFRLFKQGLMEDLLTGRVPVTHLPNEATP
jgi:type I restriction enzyme S subunit